MKFRDSIRAALFLTVASFSIGSPSHAQTAVFADNFDGSALGSSWQASTWANGSPFACTFSSSNVTKANGMLSLAFNAQSSASQDSCAEVKTTQTFQYGTFVVYMKPAWTDQPVTGPSTGTVSSFFLYTGRSGTKSHYEIDIEFVAGTKTLHTNYWVQGKQDPQDFYLPDPAIAGIDPDDGIHGYKFDWNASGITWSVQTSTGNWITLRSVPAKITAKMPVMMNVWIGDNTIAGWTGTFNPAATPTGAARYDSVTVSK